MSRLIAVHIVRTLFIQLFSIISDTIYGRAESLQKYDLIISNPPYFKLSKEDKRVKAAQCIIDGQPNIYSIFMGISALLLAEQGQMIYITQEVSLREDISVCSVISCLSIYR